MKGQLHTVESQDPLSLARALLQDLWQAAEFDGLYVSSWKGGATLPKGELLHDPARLDRADPFAPVMPVNQAPAALQALRANPQWQLGVFLRPCEWRSFGVLVNRYGERFDNLYSISADCPGVMSVEDYEQLSEEDPQDLTRQVLHFASQGGILPSRHQSSCQMCEDPFPSEVDLEFKLFGVSTDEQLMLNFKDPHVAQALSEQTPASEIPESSLVRREQVLQDLARWRASSFEKRKAQLGPDTISLQGLAAHLQSCESCRSSLKKHCPLIDIEMFVVADESRLEQFRNWLLSCSGCGVCDKDCPQDYPLFGVIFSLRGIYNN